MDLARAERHGICDTLLHVGPDAPTLCGDWSAYDLAAHLWVRENEFQYVANILASRGSQAHLRMDAAKSRLPFPALVEAIRSGPAGLSPYRLPGVDSRANAIEFFIHHEDVRRGGPDPLPPRDLGDDTEAQLWKILKRMSGLFFRKSPFGVDLQTLDGLILPVKKRRKLTVIGRPSELLLFSSGRTSVADVRIQGDPAEVVRLSSTLGI